jgi:hypothetical protein
MGADKQAESTLERNRLSAIAKIKQDLAWRTVAGVPMSQIVITRQQAEELAPIIRESRRLAM